MKGLRNFWCVIIALTISSLVAAQDFRGSLVGEVQDSNGGRIPSAKITIRGAESSFERQITADSKGEFRISDLLPGEYHLTVSFQGFAEASSDVSVVVSSVRDVLVTLKPAPISQAVTVEGQVSSITTQPIDVTTAVHEGVVSVKDLRDLPLAHRTFANIAFLRPARNPSSHRTPPRLARWRFPSAAAPD